MPTRRRVTRSEGFVERALALYPPGGSADGTPPFEMFESGPLRGVELLDVIVHPDYFDLISDDPDD